MCVKPWTQPEKVGREYGVDEYVLDEREGPVKVSDSTAKTR
jgi:hypothetical protein